VTNFTEFGLDPGCKLLDKFRIRTGFGLSLWKGIEQFLLLGSFILLSVWTLFGLGFSFYFWTMVGLGLSFKNSGPGMDRKIRQLLSSFYSST